MTEITFSEIQQFINTVENMKKSTPENMRAVVLLSLDADRTLRKMTTGSFNQTEDGTATFRGLPIIHVLADGYINTAWEVEQ